MIAVLFQFFIFLGSPYSFAHTPHECQFLLNDFTFTLEDYRSGNSATGTIKILTPQEFYNQALNESLKTSDIVIVSGLLPTEVDAPLIAGLFSTEPLPEQTHYDGLYYDQKILYGQIDKSIVDYIKTYYQPEELIKLSLSA